MTPHKRQISRLLLALLAGASLIAQPALAAHKKEAESTKKTASADSGKNGKSSKTDKNAKSDKNDKHAKVESKAGRKDKAEQAANKKDSKVALKSDKNDRHDKSDKLASKDKNDKNQKLSAREQRIQDMQAKAKGEKAGRYAKGSKAEKLALAKAEKVDRAAARLEKLTKAERAAQATDALIAKRNASDTRERRVIASNDAAPVAEKREQQESNRAAAVFENRGSGEWAGSAAATSSPGLHSRAALLLDIQNGEALYQKNANDVVPIASITKLMTAMVMLDANLPMNEELVITDEDVDTLKGSRSRLAVGTRMTRQETLLLALMSSENRAAHALGRNYPGGIPAFVAAMNRKAQELGMARSRFRDPTGLNSGNVSTAHDLAKMVAAAAKYPAIHQATTTSETRQDVLGRYLEYRNTNPLVRSGDWDISVSKTGFIREAGKCLVMQAKVNNRPMLFVLLDSEASSSRVGDANRLKKWAEATHS